MLRVCSVVSHSHMQHSIHPAQSVKIRKMDDPGRQTSYFNYFSEIEEHFLRRRGGGLLLSTLDWALIETWKDSGIPLEAALRGIDAAFERYEQRPSKTKKVNSLAYCSQEVLSAAEDMKEAAIGGEGADPGKAGKSTMQGFEQERISAYLRTNADLLDAAQEQFPAESRLAIQNAAQQAAKNLRELAADLEKPSPVRLEDLERRLTVMEEKLFATLLAAMADEEIVRVRASADRDLIPYRRKMSSAQIEQLHKQYVHKRLLDQYNLPRLSLFYM